jgi:hypothetical protein
MAGQRGETKMKIEDAIKTLEFYNFPAAKITEHEDAVAAAELAISALRAQAERENPKPLTITELKERVGKWVWIEQTEKQSGWHNVFQKSPLSMIGVDGYVTERDIQRKYAIAYDHEPKEANNEQD